MISGAQNLSATVGHSVLQKPHNVIGWQMRMELPRDFKKRLVHPHSGARRRRDQFA
jgi:hypothetical protein